MARTPEEILESLEADGILEVVGERCYCGEHLPEGQSVCGDAHCNDWARADARGLL